MAAKRSKNQARRNGGNGLPGWAWLVIGLLLGALAFAIWTVRDRWQHPSSTSLPQPNPNAQAPATRAGDETAVADTAERPKPKYDFYTLLPEREVVIPDAELDAQARAEAHATTATSASTTTTADKPVPAIAANDSDQVRYLIQAGAFRGQDEAEALKAQIALTGEMAHVETAVINDSTVYRVRMGPYPNATALAAAKQALASHGIEGAQAIRVK